jgi:D-lactate dehydrogenase
LFFENHKISILLDTIFDKLRSFPNVLITGHQAFLTKDALNGIATTTLENLDCWQLGKRSPNALTNK